MMKPEKPDIDFAAIERDVLQYWRDAGSLATLRRLRAGGPLFRFVDGPITANNPMGVHHAWGRTLKDTFLRYKAMRGHRCNYQNGFDCQGLWVEVEVEKALGFNGKPDIERFGLDNFSRACKERVNTFAAVISEQSARLGQWMDWDDSYYTMSDANMLGIWHFLRKCHEEGWIYKGSLPMPWCPRCGTSLSEHEMAGSHQDLEHVSLLAHVPLADDPKRRILVWTTTPWTLAANTALAVSPTMEYVEVTRAGWDHTLIVAAAALARCFGEVRVEIVRRLRGADLAGREYETFLPDLPAQQPVRHVIVLWDEVAEDEGSGIVHIAPGCGIADHELSKAQDLPILDPVDDAVIYRSGYGWLAGKRYDTVEAEVIERLRESGKLYSAEPYVHSYPVCWRCKGQLVFRLVGEWFIASDGVRPRLIEAARTVTWSPEFIGSRMEDWLNNMGDWCISRKRYWGLALPFYPCESCGHLTVVGSREELRERAVDAAVVDALPELHRPWIDEVRIRCAKCGAVTARVPEVGDCWLDAGIVPFTTLGYFEDREAWRGRYPVEWICEMREQVRLWFYSMLFMSVVIEGRSPYEKVLSHERVIAEDGTRFSKSGYMIVFDDAVDRMGADVMRYLFCRQAPSTESRFGYGLGDIARRRLGAFWNVYSFFTTYAVIDEPRGIERVPDAGMLHVTDRWLLARTAQFVDRARAAFDEWQTPTVVREFEEFADDLSNWYVRVNRRRFWRPGNAADKQACYATLYAALKAVTQAMAPITPFITEHVWQNLVRSVEPGAPESVHHALFPEAPAAWRDDALLAETERVRALISEALRLRSEAQVRVRQPLPVLFVKAEEAVAAQLRRQEEVVANELNVKAIRYIDDTSEIENAKAWLDLKAAGPVFRGDVNRVAQVVNALDEDTMAGVVAAIQAGRAAEVPGVDRAIDAALFRIVRDLKPGFRMGEAPGLTLWLDFRVDQELVREGLVRDLIRRIQLARREAGFGVTQRVHLRIATEDAELRAAIDAHAEVIRNEVLAARLDSGADGAAASVEPWTLNESQVYVTLEAVAG